MAIIKSILDNDFYKLSMQCAVLNYPRGRHAPVRQHQRFGAGERGSAADPREEDDGRRQGLNGRLPLRKQGEAPTARCPVRRARRARMQACAAHADRFAGYHRALCRGAAWTEK